MALKVCRFPGCTNPAWSIGACAKHYHRERRRDTARARNAGRSKPISEWHSVYVVGCDEHDYVKIGKARNVCRRLECLQVGSPYRLYIYGIMMFDPRIAYEVERGCHNVLADFGFDGRGEWWDVPAKDACDLVAKIDKDIGAGGITLRQFRAALGGVNWGFEGEMKEWLDVVESHIRHPVD